MEDSASGQEDNGPASGVAIKKACDVCRTRKVRCDRLSPCSHCRAAGLTCRTTAQRPREARSRVVISKEYENKIDRMESRLAGIESLLRQTLDSLASLQHNSLSSSSMNTPAGPHSAHAKTPATVAQEEAFEGFTSANAQSQVATDVVEQTLGQDPSFWQDTQLHGALNSLRDLAHKMKRPPGDSAAEARSQEASGDGGTAIPEIPSREDMQGLLQKVRSVTTFTFTIFLPFLSVPSFTAEAERWRREPDEVTPTQELLVCGGCYSLCCEFSAIENVDSVAQYYYRLGLIFEQRFERALANINFMIPATRESVEALIAAASAAIDMCRPSVCFSLTSAALNLAQNLGYHRYNTMTADTEVERQDKITIFWVLYQLDKNMALRLGRASMIQDFDISLPYPSPSDRVPHGMATLFAYWLDVSRVQGQVNEKLFSPGALSRSQDERFRSAAQLEADLTMAYAKRLQIQNPLGPTEYLGCDASIRESYEKILLNSDHVMHYSVLALVQYSKPVIPGQPSPALDAARKALDLFHDLTTLNTVNAYFWVSYCHWIIMNCPFTPFLVLFCHIISLDSSPRNEHDLRLLSIFCNNLKTAKHLSEGVNKLYQLCSVFCNVAESYMRAKQQKSFAARQSLPRQVAGGNEPANALEEFDDYLAMLGFVAPPTAGAADAAAAAAAAGGGAFDGALPVAEQDMSGYLQEWYSGNVSLLGLLEQDLGGVGNGGGDAGLGFGNG